MVGAPAILQGPEALFGSEPEPFAHVPAVGPPPRHAGQPRAAGLAHHFPFPFRFQGRRLFERGAVSGVARDSEKLSGRVADPGSEAVRAQVSSRGARSVRFECECRQIDQVGACPHVYALLLAHDAGVLVRPFSHEPHPHDIDHALAHRLWCVDLEIDPPANMATDHESRRIAALVDEFAENWDGPIRIGDYGDETDADTVRRRDAFRLRQLESEVAQAGQSWPRLTRLHYLIDPDPIDGIDVVIKRRTLGKNGTWGKLARLSRDGLGQLRFSAEDRALLANLFGAFATPLSTWDAWDGDRPRVRRSDPLLPTRLSYELAAELLPRMIATGRCALGDELVDVVDELDPLRMGDGRVRFVVRARTTDDGRFELAGELRRGDEVLSPNDSASSLDDDDDVELLGTAHVVVADTVYELEPIADLALATALLEDGPLSAPGNERESFLRRFVQLPGARHLEDETLVVAAPQPMVARMAIDDPDVGSKKTIAAAVTFDYGYGNVASPGQQPTHFVVDGKLIARELAAEGCFLEAIDELGIALDANAVPGQVTARLPRAGFEDCVAALVARGWEVLAAGFPVRRMATPSISVVSGRDWFDLEADLDFDGVVLTLPDLLRRKRSELRGLVRLGDGSFGLLASEWLLLSLGEAKDGVVRMRSTQAWLLDVLVRDHVGTIDIDRKFAETREALAELDKIQPCRTPRGFGTKLRGYQRDGVGWLLFLHRIGLGGCLADDMGLGKTVQVLALLERLRRDAGGKLPGPSLVVVPNSLLDNWQREAARFCPDMTTLCFFGPQRFRTHAASVEAGFGDHDLVFMTYGTLRRDIDKLANVRFYYAILDEAQAIKNDGAQVSKAARLIQADHRLALTGTPIENHLGEIWSLFEFLNPGMLGRSTVFKRLAADSGLASVAGSGEGRSELNTALRPFLLRRTKSEVLNDLPEKSEQVLYVELSKLQRRQYDELKNYYGDSLRGRLEGSELGKQQMFVLEALLRLRQTACHPGLVDAQHAKAACGKFEVLLPMLEELCDEGHKALVFSQFTSLLSLLQRELSERGLECEHLDGSTRDRQARVDRFQSDPDCRVFLISLKAGGVGLNLTAADYVFLLDPWWNPAVESQAIDRTHRIGQKNNVFAYRLIAKDTVEERVAELQAEKRELADAVLAGTGGLRGLSVADIERLLR